MVRVVIRTVGNGQVESSGGNNASAIRPVIEVPAGYMVYFNAIPAPGSTFQKFVSSTGAETVQNPTTLRVDFDGVITAHFTGGTPQQVAGLGKGLILAGATLGALLMFRKR